MSGSCVLHVWVDSDYIMGPDSHCSHAGFLGHLNTNLITFNSTLQRGQDLDKVYPGLQISSTPMNGEPLPSMIVVTHGPECMTPTVGITPGFGHGVSLDVQRLFSTFTPRDTRTPQRLVDDDDNEVPLCFSTHHKGGKL